MIWEIEGARRSPVSIQTVQQLRFLITGDGCRADEGPHEAGDVVKALGGILCEGPEEDSLQIGMQRRGHGRGFMDDAIERRPDAGALVRQFSRESLEGRHSEGIAICGWRGIAAHQQFRRGIGGRPEHHARSGEPGLVTPGDAEVHELETPFQADQHVLGLDVPVDDARLFRGFEGRHALQEQPQRHIHGEIFLDEMRQARALDVLHGEERAHLVVHAHVVDRDDVRVVQLRADLGFPLEAFHGVGNVFPVVPHGLHCHGTLQERVQGEVNHSHGAPAEDALDFVTAYFFGIE